MLRRRKTSLNNGDGSEQAAINGNDNDLPSIRRTFSSRSRTRSIPPSIADPSESSSSLPLVLTVLIPLASYITGGDLLKELVLLLFLIFYLHQLINVPWELYLASRARHRHPISQSPQTSPPEDPDASVSLPSPTGTSTQSLLHILELIYLSLSILSPLFGSLLLRFITAYVGITSLSWFSTTLFALIASLRPWNHLVERLRGHSESLHDTIGEELGAIDQLLEEDEMEKERQELLDKVVQLEQELEITKSTASLLEKRLHKLERSSVGDRNKLEHVEAKLMELILTLERQPPRPLLIKQQQSPRMDFPNPFFHPILFIMALFWISITPLNYIFPSFSSHSRKSPPLLSPISPTQRSRLHLHPKPNSRLETVLEAEEVTNSKPVLDSSSSNLETSPEIDQRDDSHSETESDHHPEIGVEGMIESSSSISNNAIFVPAKAAYTFVQGILKF